MPELEVAHKTECLRHGDVSEGLESVILCEHYRAKAEVGQAYIMRANGRPGWM